MMQTVVIWDAEDEPVRFFVVEGDYEYLDGESFGNSRTWQENDEVIDRLLFPYGTSEAVEMTTKFPTDAVKNGAKVIVLHGVL